MRLFAKLALSVSAFIAITDNAYTQSFINSPNDTIYKSGMLEDLETLSIQQFNNSTNTITLKWKKVSESVPPLWEASVCDNLNCNTSLVDSGIMYPVIPADYGLLLLHITPHVSYGTATVRYAIWDTATPALKDTLTYILTVNSISFVHESERNNYFKIYPNPVKENIQLVFANSDEYKIVLSNSIGEEVYTGISYKQITIPIAYLNNGEYFISIFTNNEKINTKKIIILK